MRVRIVQWVLALAVSAAGLAAVQVRAPGRIEKVADLRVARSVATATALDGGRVLIAGGMTDGWASLDSYELFDAGTNRVVETGTMRERRAGHTATLLPGGQVLIAGGYNGAYLRSVERFDPVARRFEPAADLVEARSGHTATLLPDGRVLIVGGTGRGWTFLRSAELYDPAIGRSEPTGSLLASRESHTAILLADGRVLIVGGHTGRRQAMEVHAKAELFDPRTGRFEAAGALGTARHKHDAVRLADGRVLIIGGADRSDRVYFATTEIYMPGAGTFAPGPTMAHRRYKIIGTSILLPDGNVLVTSGAPSAEILDVTGLAFREVAGRLPEAYRFAVAAALPDGVVLMAGGYADSNVSTTGVWLFRPR